MLLFFLPLRFDVQVFPISKECNDLTRNTTAFYEQSDWLTASNLVFG